MNGQIRHPLLASSAFIGKLQLKNKIVMAPMGSNFAGEDGHTTEQLGLITRKEPKAELD